MSEFRRFSDGDLDDPARALFQSMRADGPAPGRKAEVLAAALAAAATVTAATATAATAATVGGTTAAAAPVVSAVSGAAPAAVLPVATAAVAPAVTASALVPGVSIVKMIGAFVLGGAVTATGLVAGTQLFDPPSPSPARPSVAATVAIAAPMVPAAKTADAPGQREEDAPPSAPLTAPVESARVATVGSGPVATPSARVEKADKPDVAEPAAPLPIASATTPAEPTLADEVSSLDGARRALSSGDGPGALRALDAFQGKFPRARLGTEALVLRVEALVASGRVGEARGLGEPFLAAHPDSPFAPRVRRAIGKKENVLTIP